ncbi:MAG TPA: hypothetical protein VKG26_12440 [Bacteroidia bacterium]|nr:hypothetical protein [Bacteroidia bacterium]
MTVYIPINFPNIDELVRGTKLKPDKVRVLLHQMYLSRLSQSGYTGKQKNNILNYIFNEGYVSLHCSVLRSLLTSYYKNYMDFLIEKKLLRTRESSSSNKAYTTNFASIHYKLAPELFHVKEAFRHFRKETITDKCTIKAIKKTSDDFKLHGSRNAKSIQMESIHGALYSMEQSIRFNIQSAEGWIKNHLATLSYDNAYSEEQMEKLSDNMINQLELINSINEGVSFSCKIDQFGERLYTPLKRVARYMRQFMYFENNPETELACLDISNSQLYFSTLLVNKDIIETIIPEFLPITKITEKYGSQLDFKRYTEACINGTIYDEWIRIANHTDRNAAKKELIQILFCKNNAKMPSIKIFRNSFPSVAKFFREIKALKEDTLPFITKTYLDKKGSFKPDSYHCNLSCATQRLESRIFIKRIGQSLLDKGIEPFFTIHDSVYYPKHLTEKVQKIIEDEFHLLGLAYPKLK